MIKTSNNAAGYSLLELLVVLGIIALISATALPFAFRSIDSLALESDARLAATHIKRLRDTALDLQKDIVLTVRDGRPSELLASDGSLLTLASGATIAFADQVQMTISWDGSVSGALLISKGGRKLKIYQAQIHKPITVEKAP